MKKKLLFGILTLSAAGLLCGFDSSKTLDDILQESSEAMASFSSLSSDLTFNVDVGLSLGDGTTTFSTSVLLNADLAIDVTQDPYAARVEGTFLMNLAGENESIDLQLYSVLDEDGRPAAYIYTAEDGSEEGEWIYTENSDYDLSLLLDAAGSVDFGSISNWDLPLTLAPEAEECNGTECYVVSTSIDMTAMENLQDRFGDTFGEELPEESDSFDEILSLLDGLVLDADFYLDTDACQPAGIHLDFNSSDLDNLNAAITSFLASFDSEDAETDFELLLNDISLDLTLSYDDADPITVPSEALDAAREQEASAKEQEASSEEGAAV